jgi:hypothetical protein
MLMRNLNWFDYMLLDFPVILAPGKRTFNKKLTVQNNIFPSTKNNLGGKVP